MVLVCTYDAFSAYCAEAEENGINEYELYYWTKATIDNPEKKAKHIKSYAFIMAMIRYMNSILLYL